jgi:hypothetical protein
MLVVVAKAEGWFLTMEVYVVSGANAGGCC